MLFYKRNNLDVGVKSPLKCGQDQISVASVSLSPGMFHQVLYMFRAQSPQQLSRMSSLYLHFTDEETEPQHVKAGGKVGGEHQSVRAESPYS